MGKKLSLDRRVSMMEKQTRVLPQTNHIREKDTGVVIFVGDDSKTQSEKSREEGKREKRSGSSGSTDSIYTQVDNLVKTRPAIAKRVNELTRDVLALPSPIVEEQVGA